MDAAPVQSSAEGEMTLAEWLRAKPFTLAMASSFFGFFAHAGALQVRLQRRARQAAHHSDTRQLFLGALV